jgi:TM2 domain-containing membrane protein YozV
MGAQMMGTPAVVAPMAVQPVVVVQQTMVGSQPSTILAYVLWFFLGWIGIHHLYMGRGIGIWLLSLITLQGLTLWWFIDLFLIPSSCSKIR